MLYWFYGTEDARPPADGTDMGIVPVALNDVDSVSSNLFIAALVDHLCSLYVQNSTKKDKLFQSMLVCDFIFFAVHFYTCDKLVITIIRIMMMMMMSVNV